MKASTRLKPLKQRLTELQDGLAQVQSQLKVAAGIEVIHVALCGHQECGVPPPRQLPEDAWVVVMGCSHQTPDEVDHKALQAESARGPDTPTPEQQAIFEELMATAQERPSKSRLLNR